MSMHPPHPAAPPPEVTDDDIIADPSQPTSTRIAHLLNKRLHNFAEALPIASFIVRNRQLMMAVLTIEQIPTPHPVSPMDHPSWGQEGQLPRPLADYATTFYLPPEVHGQATANSVRVGTCVYGRYPGRGYVYITFGELEAYGLQEDGTWRKYGYDFGTPQAAVEALLTIAEKRAWTR